MAIKERKQITGTTEQINAYEGHEGQIVWDKDKKTFVGMSGTAGTNYPLAQQAYVDDGLAGKEDKGVCLPLTGGELTGSLLVKGMDSHGSHASIYTKDPSKELMITAGNADFTKGGGALTLYGKDHEYQGGWVLLARGVDDNVITLGGYPDGTLVWGSKLITYITSTGDIPGSGNYIRYSDGTQICAYKTGSDSTRVVLSYPVPFVHLYSTLVDNPHAYSTDWSTTSITIQSTNGEPLGYFSYFSIGRWK